MTSELVYEGTLLEGRFRSKKSTICCYIYKTVVNMDYVNVCVYMNLKRVESMILNRVLKDLNL